MTFNEILNELSDVIIDMDLDTRKRKIMRDIIMSIENKRNRLMEVTSELEDLSNDTNLPDVFDMFSKVDQLTFGD